MYSNTDILKKHKTRKYTGVFRGEPDLENLLLIEFAERALPGMLRDWASKPDYDFSLGTFIHSFDCSVSFIRKLAEKFPSVKSALDFAVESAKLKISESVYNRFRAEFLVRFLDSMFNAGAAAGVPDVIIFKPAGPEEEIPAGSVSSDI